MSQTFSGDTPRWHRGGNPPTPRMAMSASQSDAPPRDTSASLRSALSQSRGTCAASTLGHKLWTALPSEHATRSPTKTAAVRLSSVSMSCRHPSGARFVAVATATPVTPLIIASLKLAPPDAPGARAFSNAFGSTPEYSAMTSTSRRMTSTIWRTKSFPWPRSFFSSADLSKTKTLTSSPSFLRVAE